MRLLFDEMLSPKIAAELRQRGYDVVAVAESVELRRQPDPLIFAKAKSDDRVVVTKNIGDFRMLAIQALHDGESHSGLILINDRRFPGHDPRSIGRIVSAFDELLADDVDLIDSEYWLQ